MKTELQKYERYGQFIVNRNEILGCGSFGHVYKGYNLDTLKPIAVKETRLDESIQKQINTLKILSHPNIIEYLDYKKYKDRILMFMELCNEGNLDDLLLYTTSVDKLIHYYKQIIAGVKEMYDNNILHRDLKPSNILISRKTIKIADFGTSKIKNSIRENQHQTLVGTLTFSSPEVLKMRLGQATTYTDESQIWSLGLILFYMFNYQREAASANQRQRLSLPWFHPTQKGLLEEIQSKPLVFKNNDIPPEVKDIIRRMLVVNPAERMKFSELFQITLFQSSKPTFSANQMKTRPEATITLSSTMLRQVDQHLVDKLLQVDREVQDSLLEVLSIRDKGLFASKLSQSLQNIYGNKYNSFCLTLHQMAYDSYRTYLSFSASSFSNTVHKDRQFLKQLQARYPNIKDGLSSCKETLTKCVAQFLKDHLAFVDGKEEYSVFKANQTLILCLIYDALIVYSLDSSWPSKNSHQRQLQEFYELRNKHVRNKSILRRVKTALAQYKQLKI